ncbi:hypothetical protein IFM89_003604 [Coptis chinensis]|uniref:Transposase n=1 Tax=Coptis chinensis TaxID=261450 RepID=A0A835LG76_9MAGN|nr:hypothetical protein IFM89_003604 [Coptis chinensis]
MESSGQSSGPSALQPPPSGQATPPASQATPPVTSESSGAPSSGEFEYDVPMALAYKQLQREFSSKFRTAKSNYRKEIIKKALSKEAAIAACPDGMNPTIWAAFVTREFRPEVVQRNAKNASNRKMNTIGHTLGRQKYAQIRYKKKQKNPNVKVRREDDWLTVLNASDGSVLESARVAYEQVKSVKERKAIEASARGEEDTDEVIDLEGDVLVEVFGKDKKGCTRAVGSQISPAQVEHICCGW